MRQRSIDILVVIALTSIAVTLVCTVPANNVAVRILALPLVFFLPGYALTALLFSRQTSNIVERIVFSLGISLILVILSGLVLNLTPSGLQPDTWAALSGAITLAASIVTLLRQQTQSAPASQSARSRYGFTFRQGLLLALAVIILGGALAISIIGAERQPYPGFTQLWILPAQGANTKNAVLLGVRNMEKTAMGYRLVVNMGSKEIKQWPSLDLQSGENWEATLAIPQTQHAEPTMIEAILYRLDAPTGMYRHVELWLST